MPYLTLDTKFGPMEMQIFAEHIYLNADRPSVLVNRDIPYYVSAHVFQHADGELRVGEEKNFRMRMYDGYGLYVRRRDGTMKDPSEAARKAFLVEIESAINKFRAEHAEIFTMRQRQAQQDAQRALIAKLYAKREELETELAKVSGELKAAEADLDRMRSI